MSFSENRKRILVLTDKYFPRPYANAMCAQEIINVLTEMGNQVDILAYEDFDGNPNKWEGNTVYHVRPDKRLRLYYYADTYRSTYKGKCAKFLANLLSKTKGLILLPWQPFYSFSFPRRIYKSMNQLNEKKKYDAILAILNPLDSNIAACKFKSRNPNIPYIVFCVDTLRKTFIEQHISKNFADAFIWEKKILKHCDAYFYMESRRDDYQLTRYNPFREKLHEADMPRLHIKDLSSLPKYDFSENAEHWVYAGSIGGPHYKADDMLNIFNEISENPKRVLHLFVRGNEADRIESLAKKNNWSVVVHGYVDFATLESVMATADVIVSLKTSDQISAKIFECISYGKPIVHFSGDLRDPNVQYLNKYKLSKIVKTYNSKSTEIEELQEFLEKSQGKTVDMIQIEEAFKKNTPEFSANAILEQIKKAQQI